jgi:hypothetical protein
MSKAQVGHSANDAAAGVRGELSSVDDDPARNERFLTAAIEHTAAQVELLSQQYQAVSAKADEVATWHAEKVDEAKRMLDAARDELAAFEDELEDVVG